MQNNVYKAINLLPPELCNQIAAGEVVERPASVLKELLENSLDAGADNIVVNIEDGGQGLISVFDNGFGIAAHELELAVAIHATSKIYSFEELLQVSSYGFRGEALASIASVSKFKLSSRKRNADGSLEEAAALTVNFGKNETVVLTALSQGTHIEVRDIFANVPARLKFLKTNSTELKRCQEVFFRVALANLGVNLSLNAGGREIYKFMAGEDLGARLGRVWPEQVSAQLLPFDALKYNIRVHGLSSTPNSSQPKSDRMLFYVNSRPVNSKLLVSALREAYKGRLLAREYPQTAMFIEIDPAEIDVNVHPAKTEIRFRDERSVFSAVLNALSKVTQSTATLPNYTATTVKRQDIPSLPGIKGLDRSKREHGFWGSIDNPALLKRPESIALERNTDTDFDLFDEEQNRVPYNKYSVAEALVTPYNAKENFISSPMEAENKAGSSLAKVYKIFPDTHNSIENMQYLGQVERTYLIVKHENELFVIDQHAAHERILAHKFTSESEQGHTQLLALPLELNLHTAELHILHSIWDFLKRIGFIFSTLQEGKIDVLGIPPLFDLAEAKEFLREVLAEKISGLDDLLAMMSCKAAIKAGQTLTDDEALGLIKQWLTVPHKEFCPHGRPAVVKLASFEFEKMFKRRP